jgi:hypothetical protein
VLLEKSNPVLWSAHDKKGLILPLASLEEKREIRKQEARVRKYEVKSSNH